MGTCISVRNVNNALAVAMNLTRKREHWRRIAPRGMGTLEWKGVFATEYQQPMERVLFNADRDCNPYFHFFEALWILAGRDDVEFLAQFNPRMRDYSDNKLIFHAPYGARLRGTHHFDQIDVAIRILRKDNDTRQVVMTIWEPEKDLGAVTKDLPCNDMIFLKIREGALNMTVCCRSNDMIWGAYGANAVQFSMIQEFMARAVGVKIGTYTQISDSFHVYEDNDVYKRLVEHIKSKGPIAEISNPYNTGTVAPYPIMEPNADYDEWLGLLEDLIDNPDSFFAHAPRCDEFFTRVVQPMWNSWKAYKAHDYPRAVTKIDACAATDWRLACHEWLARREQRVAA